MQVLKRQNIEAGPLVGGREFFKFLILFLQTFMYPIHKLSPISKETS